MSSHGIRTAAIGLVVVIGGMLSAGFVHGQEPPIPTGGPKTLPLAMMVTTTADTGPGSLRQALLDANDYSHGSAVILFAIPATDPNFVDVDSTLPGGDPDPDVFVIQPADELPSLRNPQGIEIHGQSQAMLTQDTNPFGPEIVLDGSLLPEDRDCLRTEGSSNNRIYGLNLQGASRDGIRICWGGWNVVAGCYIGTDATGTQTRGNGQRGIVIDFSFGNQIGGADATDRNVISGNGWDGIHITGNLAVDNIVQGNYIGLDATGSVALGNGSQGIDVSGAPRTRIGGPVTGQGNVVSGNGANGMQIREASPSCRVEGNIVGLDATGTVPVGNGQTGVDVWMSWDARIGGGASGEGNLISGNAWYGVRVGFPGDRYRRLWYWPASQGGNDHYYSMVVAATWQDAEAMAVRAGGHLVTINNAAENAFLAGIQSELGDFWIGLSDLAEEGAFVWASGQPVEYTNWGIYEPNGGTSENCAVFVNGGTWNDLWQVSVMWGIAEFDSAPTDDMLGVLVDMHPTIQGNRIGTDISGSADLGNGSDGILLVWCSHALVGGSLQDQGNLISGNSGHGIFVARSPDATISGNRIGVIVDGTSGLGNQFCGVAVEGSARTLIGGTGEFQRNVISGNGEHGVVIRDHSVACLVQGNRIGTDPDGMFAIGNWNTGVVVSDSTDVVIGGAQPSEGNVISGNNWNGIAWEGFRARAGRVRGNFIGVAADGLSGIPNGNSGIEVGFHVPDLLIGGAAEGEGNIISANLGAGITVWQRDSRVRIYEWPVAEGGNGHWYIATPPLTWEEAEQVAVSLGGHLATVNSQAEQDFIQQTILPDWTGIPLWVGLNDRDTEGVWAWISGEPANYFNWVPGEPDLQDQNEVLINWDSAGRWVNHWGLDKDASLIELDSEPVIPDVVALVFADSLAIQGNRIGTDSTGAVALGNGTFGISVDNSCGVRIGGIAAGQGNTIAFNTADGVAVWGDEAMGNPIRGNSIHDNGDLGIDLDEDGPTANDAGDVDSGPNLRQNYPLLQCTSTGASVRVTGTLISTPLTAFDIDVYADADVPGQAPEGRQYLGATSVTTNAAGSAAINLTVPRPQAGLDRIIATATDPTGNTSEFSSGCGFALLLGDINGDGYVNVGDLQALVAAWGSHGNPPIGNWNPAADINSDMYINVGDLQILVAHWGQSSN